MDVGKCVKRVAQSIDALLHPTTETIGIKTKKLQQCAIVIARQFSPNVRRQLLLPSNESIRGFSITMICEISFTSTMGIPVGFGNSSGASRAEADTTTSIAFTRASRLCSSERKVAATGSASICVSVSEK